MRRSVHCATFGDLRYSTNENDVMIISDSDEEQ